MCGRRPREIVTRHGKPAAVLVGVQGQDLDAVVVLVGLATIAIKSIGSVLLGDRDLPPRVASLIGLVAPALLGALVAINTFGSGRSLVLDERALGVAAVASVIWRKASVLLVVAIVAAITAIARALL
jgi:branched-subunit amino acid transport protein